MAKSQNNQKSSDRVFNTLEQFGTSQSDQTSKDNPKRIQGNGTSKASMKKRPRKKLLTTMLCKALIKVAKEQGDTRMEQKYRNSIYCQNEITTHEGRAYGKYCGMRWCSICNANRKAHMINRYKPIIDTWKEPYLLTLTAKAHGRLSLSEHIDFLIKTLNMIYDKHRKRNERGNGIKIKYLQCLEANYNPVAKTYNPHLHIITPNYEVAKILNVEWLRYLGKDMAYFGAQDFRRIRNNNRDLIEVIKYGAKILTDPEMKKGKKRVKNPVIYAAALHELYKVFDKRRLLTTKGFKLSQGDTKKCKEQWIVDGQEWIYDDNIKTYVDVDTGAAFPDWSLDPELAYIYSDRINYDSN